MGIDFISSINVPRSSRAGPAGFFCRLLVMFPPHLQDCLHCYYVRFCFFRALIGYLNSPRLEFFSAGDVSDPCFLVTCVSLSRWFQEPISDSSSASFCFIFSLLLEQNVLVLQSVVHCQPSHLSTCVLLCGFPLCCSCWPVGHSEVGYTPFKHWGFSTCVLVILGLQLRPVAC